MTEQRRAAQALTHFNDALEAQVLQRTSQLEAANKELEAFVYSASHDLRAPLRAIDGFSQMIVEDASDRLDASDLEHLQRVRAATRRMALLIDHLIALSRTARQDLLRAPTDLSALAESVLADLREAEPERRVRAVVEPGLAVDADAALLHVILTNLLNNAWKFTSHHDTARIEVGACEAQNERVFFVKDDGAGFDPEQASHLFGAFQRCTILKMSSRAMESASDRSTAGRQARRPHLGGRRSRHGRQLLLHAAAGAGRRLTLAADRADGRPPLARIDGQAAVLSPARPPSSSQSSNDLSWGYSTRSAAMSAA